MVKVKSSITNLLVISASRQRCCSTNGHPGMISFPLGLLLSFGSEPRRDGATAGAPAHGGQGGRTADGPHEQGPERQPAPVAPDARPAGALEGALRGARRAAPSRTEPRHPRRKSRQRARRQDPGAETPHHPGLLFVSTEF